MTNTWTPACDRLPKIETPVLCVYRGEHRIFERRIESPTGEETFKAFYYWDDPVDDGQEILDTDVTHWMPLPTLPPLHKCKYCGAASYVDPSDQEPPPDYCHESDHGSAE